MNFAELLGEEDIQNKETLVIDLGLGDGSTVTLSPILEGARQPRLNTTKTMTLTTTNWHSMVTDSPYSAPALKVVNKSGNPGEMDVRIVTSSYLDNTHYYWNLPVNYYASFSFGMPDSYTVWVSASSVAGDYKVQAYD